MSWRQQYIVLGSSFVQPDLALMRETISFLLGRELGRLRLGHASWFTDLLLAYVNKIPYLSNPLLRIFTYSEDRYGALLEPASLLGLVSIASALWPATAYGSGLARAFHELSGRSGPPKPARGRALTLAVLLPAFVIGGLIASYAGTALVGEDGSSLVIGWALALAFGFVATTAVVTLIYRLFPGRRFLWVQILRAAAAVAAGISVISLLFVLFLNLGADFQAHYATSGIASVVFLALWLYLSNMMLLAGYELSLDRSSTRRPNASQRLAAKR